MCGRYRHVKCPFEECSGLWILRVFDPFRATFTGLNGTWGDSVWDVRLKESAIYVGMPAPPPWNYSPLSAASGLREKHYITGDKQWRHLALQLDELTDQIKFFLDGALVHAGPSWKPIRTADWHAPHRRMAVGHYGDNMIGGPTSIADLRFYRHAETGGPLSAAALLQIAQAPPATLSPQHTCLPVSSTEIADSNQWRDAHGRTCEWYHKAKDLKPAVCMDSDVAANCPTSCHSRQECYMPRNDVGVYFAWDRIQLLMPRPVGGGEAATAGNGSVPGLICPAANSKKADLVRECKAWLASGEGAANEDVMRTWLETAYGNLEYSFLVLGPGRVNVTNCDHLKEALEDSCAFDAAGVRAFTREMRASKGWSISFWVKPVGPESLSEDGQFQPQISFFHKLSPPQAPLSLLMYSDYEHPQIHLRSTCSQPPNKYLFSALDALSTTDWTFVSFSVEGSYDDVDETVSGWVLWVCDSGE
jgi:hypothetical protein